MGAFAPPPPARSLAGQQEPGSAPPLADVARVFRDAGIDVFGASSSGEIVVGASILAGDAEDPLKSHRREVTVVFLDLRGFTAFAETAEPRRSWECSTNTTRPWAR